MEIGEYLDSVKEIAVIAGEILIDNYRDPQGIKIKDDGTFVTEVDIKSSKLISDRLRLINPDFAILDEETREDGSRFKKDFCWVVDPLDGTKGYINKSRNFGVLIGLLHKFEPVMGVCYKPLVNELTYAVKDKGAYLSINDATKRLGVSSTRSLDRVLVSASRRTSEIDSMLTRLNTGKIIPMDSSLKIVEVAKGNAELFLCPPSSTMYLWDLCAPQVILNEAGGRMTDIEGNNFDYSRRETANEKGVLASNGFVHNKVVEVISGA